MGGLYNNTCVPSFRFPLPKGGGNMLLEEIRMSTYMPKPADITRKWYILDAAGKPLGRLAATAAHILRGKHKPTYMPHVDGGDSVIIINAAQVILTGRKREQKTYKWHTGWIGGLKEIQYGKLLDEQPERAITIAVKGMLPGNSIGRTAITRLHVYRDSAHKNAAQKPEVYPL